MQKKNLEIDFYFRDQVIKSAKYINLLYLCYKPAFFIHVLMHMQIFLKKERLYSLKSNFPDDAKPPFHRFEFISGDLNLIIISNDYSEENLLVHGQKERTDEPLL